VLANEVGYYLQTFILFYCNGNGKKLLKKTVPSLKYENYCLKFSVFCLYNKMKLFLIVGVTVVFLIITINMFVTLVIFIAEDYHVIDQVKIY